MLNESYITLLISRQLRNPLLDLISPLFSLIFLSIFWLLIFFSLAVIKRKERYFLLLLAFALNSIAILCLKNLIGRPRPSSDGYPPFLKPLDPSFPSGHASTAFLLATLLGHFHPKVRVLLFSLAFFASFLRIYQGVHYPSDLLGGALLGIGIGIFFLRYKKGILDLLKGILK